MDENELMQNHFKEVTLEVLLNVKTTSQDNVKTIIECIRSMMEIYAKKLSYSQIRNVFKEIKKNKSVSDLYMATTRLAYMEARLKQSDPGRKLITFIRMLAGEVKTEPQRDSFIEIMNTIVAYHKLYGNKR